VVNKLVKMVTVVGLFGLIASGCGGDDSSSSGTTAGERDESTTTSAASSGSDAGGLAGLLDEDCQFLLSGSFLNPLANLTNGKADDVEHAGDYLSEVAAEAPREIKDDLTTVAEGISKVAEELKGVDLTDPSSYTKPEVQEKMQGLQEIFDEDYQKASENVSTWITENCKPGG
jgi:hypothetical protein